MSPTSNHQWLFLSIRILLVVSFGAHFSEGVDTIYAGQSLSGTQTITSRGGVFELGFFTPGNSRNYYIGIWYMRPRPSKTVVWVANRNRPVSDPSSSELKLFEDGILVLLVQSKTRIWSTNLSTSSFGNSTVAMLLDNGNFIVRDALDSANVIWQSFDYPTDTWLPGGKVGYSNVRKQNQFLTSWRNPENPAPSLFSLEVEPSSSLILVWKGSNMYWNSGVWDGRVFSSVPEIATDYYIKNITYVVNENESYFTYEAGFVPALTRFVVDVTGQIKIFVWRKDSTYWDLFWTQPTLECEVYGFCGAFSSCGFSCSCIYGFEPRTPVFWRLGYFSDGCVRRSSLECANGGNDTFSLVSNARFPGNSESLAAGTFDECQLACLRNCSCTAFAFDNGCLIWNGALFNLQEGYFGKDLYVRVAKSKLVVTGINSRAGGKTKKKSAWIVLGAVGFFFMIFFGGILMIIWRKRQTATATTFEAAEDSLLVFKFRDIRDATKNFSEKLGEGGFGSVFRGTLPNSSAAIAVKVLKTQRQEEKQFRAEVNTIGMIQHINLVHLRGFCVKGTQRLLVYNYMPNGSLESHLFKKGSNVLDWKARYNIAIGTARGLAYLHEKCRDCIIHCDIKPENILLDADYNPKVSDFGLAKLVGREFSRVLTTMRGTIGYLAPEWISGEAITPKADVFSYGMLLFEIISGRRNREGVEGEVEEYFPYQVSSRLLDGEEILVALLDHRLQGNADVEELSRACKIACWCIQDEKDRPSMGQVVQVLEGVQPIGIPPIPRFLQGIMDDTKEAFVFQDTSSIISVKLS
ncbi:G-type lectin S-receptor-like serine/threonine-protein kinase At2g19130 [Diospyros lotus]|uniref:G-type lectin S-receptor-like serine/threonine-protein kinase At2g19130 n=1 Tax=Diospyros lotus TaxID=55363 RepID=UPI00225A42D9|nr:G-type lectin S-receptor-like serine/threonine-protein kinase At2g19130 [Diospyros lotus]